MASSFQENVRFSITKLNDVNYYQWKYTTKMMLLKEGLWDLVTDNPPNPETPEWRKRDGSARATIALSMEANQTNIVRHSKTAKEMWTNIKRAKEMMCMSARRSLQWQINTLRKNNMSMSDYINLLSELTDKLSAAGEETTEIQSISILLGGLPESYDNIVIALENKEESSLSLDFVKSKLMEEENRRQARNTDTTNGSLLYTQQQVRRCYYCGDVSHIRRDCVQYKRNHIINTSSRNSQSSSGHGWSQQSMNAQEREVTIPSKTGQETDQVREEQAYIAFASYQSIEQEQKHIWILDSGANAHMSGQLDLFLDYTSFSEQKSICVANGKELSAIGTGTCELQVTNHKGKTNIKLLNTLYVPQMVTNLISINKICDAGYDVTFTHDGCKATKNDKVYLSGRRMGGLFVVDTKPVDSCNSACLHEWHSRLGHRSLVTIKEMQRNHKVKNLDISPCSHSDQCEICDTTKMIDISFDQKAMDTVFSPFKKLSTDLCGPISPTSLGGARYFITIQDQFSKFTQVNTLKSKDEATNVIIEFVLHWHNHFGYWPESIRSDGGGEFENNILNQFLTEHGIKHELIIPYCPQQNGAAERKKPNSDHNVQKPIKGKDIK